MEDRYKPITEGYQPGSQIQKPQATAVSPRPPSGGSSATKPVIDAAEVLGAWREWRQAESELHSAAAAMDHWTDEAGAEFDRAHKRKQAAWTKVSFLLDRLSVSVLRDE